jgi:hypothetical protein
MEPSFDREKLDVYGLWRPNHPEEERRHPVLTGGDFEHEDEHEEQSISQQPLAKYTYS